MVVGVRFPLCCRERILHLLFINLDLVFLEEEVWIGLYVFSYLSKVSFFGGSVDGTFYDGIGDFIDEVVQIPGDMLFIGVDEKAAEVVFVWCGHGSCGE